MNWKSFKTVLLLSFIHLNGPIVSLNASPVLVSSIDNVAVGAVGEEGESSAAGISESQPVVPIKYFRRPHNQVNGSDPEKESTHQHLHRPQEGPQPSSPSNLDNHHQLLLKMLGSSEFSNSSNFSSLLSSWLETRSKSKLPLPPTPPGDSGGDAELGDLSADFFLPIILNATAGAQQRQTRQRLFDWLHGLVFGASSVPQQEQLFPNQHHSESFDHGGHGHGGNEHGNYGGGSSVHSHSDADYHDDDSSYYMDPSHNGHLHDHHDDYDHDYEHHGDHDESSHGHGGGHGHVHSKRPNPRLPPNNETEPFQLKGVHQVQFRNFFD